MRKVDVIWNIRFEVTFYGVDKEGKSFREIKENKIKFDDNFEIKNQIEILLAKKADEFQGKIETHLFEAYQKIRFFIIFIIL